MSSHSSFFLLFFVVFGSFGLFDYQIGILGIHVDIFYFCAMPGAWPLVLLQAISNHGFGKGNHLDSDVGPALSCSYSCALLDFPSFVPGLLSSRLPKVKSLPMDV